MKLFVQLLIFLLITSCKIKTYETLEYTIINKNSISEFKGELEIFMKVNELRNNKIDFVVYRDYSVGSVRLVRNDDPNNCLKCVDHFSIFLIWNEGQNNFLQIFDNCGNFLPIKLNNSNILNFSKENLRALNIERVKYYQTNKNTVSMVSHSRYKEFLFSLNGEEIYNFYDTYNLKSDSERPNLNYSFNQKLNLIRLNNMIEEEIKNQTDLNAFKRDLTQCK